MVDQIAQILKMVKNGQIGQSQAMELIKVLRDVQSHPKGSPFMMLEINSVKGDVVRVHLPISMVKYMDHFVVDDVIFETAEDKFNIHQVIERITDGYRGELVAILTDGSEMKITVQE